MRLFDVKSMWSRRRSAPLVTVNSTSASAHDHDETGATSNGTTAVATIETKPSRRASMAELQRGYDEVLGVVRRIGDHLDEQSERSERIVALLDRLPQAVDVMPEISRQNIRLLESLTEYLDQAKRREESINSTLARLNDSSDHQAEIVSLVQQQLDAGTDNTRQMTSALTSFRQSLSELSASTKHSSDVLATVSRSSEDRETRLVTMMARTERWLVAAMACSVTAAVAAVGVAMFALLRSSS
ncbi:MAG: hypothetical protein AAF432_01690 [Planctomycetota bacterium]